MKDQYENGKAHFVVSAPVTGRLLPLPLVEDEVFSAGILGDGVAVVPESNEICAPCDGTVDALFDSHHAVSMTADFGAELLIHCGIDTVELKGEGFSPLVKQGEHVKRGQPLLHMDVSLLKERGYYTTTPVLLVNGESFAIKKVTGDRVGQGEPLMTLTPRTEGRA